MALSAGLRFPFFTADTPELVNDIHSQLNLTRVDRIIRPVSADKLRKAVLDAKRAHKSIAISGGRHAMGGQQFAAGAVLVDMTGMNQVHLFNPDSQTIEDEAGIFWPELVRAYLQWKEGRSNQWGIAQKQTGADRLSIGGTLAANAHGRGLRMKPLISNTSR